MWLPLPRPASANSEAEAAGLDFPSSIHSHLPTPPPPVEDVDMEWMKSVAQYGQDKATTDEDMVDEDDFYGDGMDSAAATTKTPVNDALPGAAQDPTAMVRDPREMP